MNYFLAENLIYIPFTSFSSTKEVGLAANSSRRNCVIIESATSVPSSRSLALFQIPDISERFLGIPSLSSHFLKKETVFINKAEN
jgi:hypothetical protein